jgi:carbamate kinase
MRCVVALGGNAMTAADGRARPADQLAAIGRAAESIAELIASGVEVVLTHGNGPQVGNLLVKNELAAAVVPPVPLDWCVAQTQATIGAMLINALEAALAGAACRNASPRSSPVPGSTRPTTASGPRPKPIGRYLPAAEAAAMVAHGQVWQDRGERGWRRVVASPEPIEVLDAPAVAALAAAGFVVVAAGGGGVPVVRDATATRGVEAVIDKDLTAAVLARAVGADVLVIATDVAAVALRFGTPSEQALGRLTVGQARAYAAAGEFAGGSMGPKVEAACRFVDSGGRYAVITSLGSHRRRGPRRGGHRDHAGLNPVTAEATGAAARSRNRRRPRVGRTRSRSRNRSGQRHRPGTAA